MKSFQQITSLLLCLLLLSGILSSCDRLDLPDATVGESTNETEKPQDGEDGEEEEAPQGLTILELEKLTLDGFERQDLFHFTLSVGEDVETIPIADKVWLPEGCHWSLLRYGETIQDKTLVLEDGDNFFSIHTWTDAGQSLSYELKVYRAYKVTVFYCLGDTFLYSERVTAGEPYELQYEPKFEQYNFLGWHDGKGNDLHQVTPKRDVMVYAKVAFRFPSER